MQKKKQVNTYVDGRSPYSTRVATFLRWPHLQLWLLYHFFRTSRRISAMGCRMKEKKKSFFFLLWLRYASRSLQLPIVTAVVAARWRIHDRLGIPHLPSLRHLTTLLVLETFAQNQGWAGRPGGV